MLWVPVQCQLLTLVGIGLYSEKVPWYWVLSHSLAIGASAIPHCVGIDLTLRHENRVKFLFGGGLGFSSLWWFQKEKLGFLVELGYDDQEVVFLQHKWPLFFEEAGFWGIQLQAFYCLSFWRRWVGLPVASRSRVAGRSLLGSDRGFWGIIYCCSLAVRLWLPG